LNQSNNWIAYILCGIIVGQFGVVVALLWNMPFRYVLRRDYDQNRQDMRKDYQQNRTEMLSQFKELFSKMDKLRPCRKEDSDCQS